MLGCVWGLWFSGSQISRIQACGLAKATAEATGIAPGPGIDLRVGPGIDLRVGPGIPLRMDPATDPGAC